MSSPYKKLPASVVKSIAERLSKCNLTHDSLAVREPDVTYCNATWDLFSCWSTTRAGDMAVQPCFESGLSDASNNATRVCLENGTWDKSNYTKCMGGKDQRLLMEAQEPTGVLLIYDIGYSITTISLVAALIIFFYFKSLRCLRNSIHCNLFAALLFSNVKWFILRLSIHKIRENIMCNILVVVMHYFHTSLFFWMFVEGLYLFTIILWAFSAQKLRLWHYLLIGWGVPLIIMVVWTVLKLHYEQVLCFLPHPNYPHLDYIMYMPILIVLLSNVFFIVTIIWILVTKLRASNTLETRQSRKALKAIVVLLPLLGLGYVLFLEPPVQNEILVIIFKYINAVLQSLQGFFVTIFYCFLNGEVRVLLRQKISALQDSRTLSRYTKSSFFGSPRRSSCYAMAATNGKATPGLKRISGGSGQSKLSRTCEAETEASASMMDNML
ncbi:corticotropin-releasing factor receptor 2-like [Physella acuta]|uniref:corticotropin-releasing factor receptor 2-like n=1 Tax=Physella acuta TaxID=109671 RepID=UPI0027DE1A7B|nr:corticotropin-releasing factor receptor 2-like [Physella acuta]XP_059165542.1 corticotropin-releasing factor receptor 2-like [Physella acuta]